MSQFRLETEEDMLGYLDINLWPWCASKLYTWWKYINNQCNFK